VETYRRDLPVHVMAARDQIFGPFPQNAFKLFNKSISEVRVANPNSFISGNIADHIPVASVVQRANRRLLFDSFLGQETIVWQYSEYPHTAGVCFSSP
jgi:hypothetical protein